jgi:hypothetical protein
VSRLLIIDDLKTVDGSSVSNWPTSSGIIEDTWPADEEFSSLAAGNDISDIFVT